MKPSLLSIQKGRILMWEMWPMSLLTPTWNKKKTHTIIILMIIIDYMTKVKISYLSLWFFLIFLKRKIWNATFREYSIKTLYCWSPTSQNMRICYLYHHVCINIVRLLLINTPWITGPGTRHALLIWLVPCQYQVDKCEVAVGITQTSQRYVWIYIVQRFLSGVYLDLVSLTFILFLFILLHFIFRCFF